MFFKDTTYFHYKDIGDCIYPVNTSLQVSFTQSIILGSTTYIILTFLLYPQPFMLFSQNVLATSLL
jgi:hypothetical protein